MGKIKDYIYNIKIKHDIVGKIELCRKISVHLMKQIKAELMRMFNSNVIKKIDKPTEFDNPGS